MTKLLQHVDNTLFYFRGGEKTLLWEGGELSSAGGGSSATEERDNGNFLNDIHFEYVFGLIRLFR